MADGSSFPGPRSEIRRVTHGPRIDGHIVEDSSDEAGAQNDPNHTSIPVTPAAPQFDVTSILPPGETPLSWFIKSQSALQAMYAQLCAQTGTPAVQAPVQSTQVQAQPVPRVLSYNTQGHARATAEPEMYSRTQQEEDSQRRPSVHSRLGPRVSHRGDTQHEESY